MKLIKFNELFSITSTGIVVSDLVNRFAYSGALSHNEKILAGVAGAGVALALMRTVVDVAKKAGNTTMVMVLSTPFIASWVLLAPTITEVYYSGTYGATSSPIVEKKMELESKIEKSSANINALRYKLSNSVANVSGLRAEVEDTLSKLRSEYKQLLKAKRWREASEHPYKVKYLDAYKSAYGKIDTFSSLVEFIYSGKKRDIVSGVATKKSSIQTKINIEKDNLKDLKNRLQQLPNAITKKEFTETNMTKAYILMFFVGLLIEILITHTEYFLLQRKNLSANKSIHRVYEEIRTNHNHFLALLNKDRFNRDLAILFAIIDVVANGKEPSSKNIREAVSIKSPHTKRKYKIHLSHITPIRRDLKALGCNLDDFDSNRMKQNLLTSIEKYVNRTRSLK